MGTYINKGNSNFRDIVLVGINYDKETKQHTCRIERVEKQS